MNDNSTASAASSHHQNDRPNAEEDIPRTAPASNRTTDQTQNQNQNSNQQRHQGIPPIADQEQTTPTSKVRTTQAGEEDHPVEIIGEELETDVFRKLTSSIKPLPVSLQSQALEWREKLLLLKDKIQTKKHALENSSNLQSHQNQQSSNSN